MESENRFNVKDEKPTDAIVSDFLGESRYYWEDIKQTIREQVGEFTEEWKFYGSKCGWTLKILWKKRNLFFFTVYPHFFRIAFVFGDKAVEAVISSDLRSDIKKSLQEARKYAEGRGLRLDVRTSNDAECVKKLITIKIAH